MQINIAYIYMIIDPSRQDSYDLGEDGECSINLSLHLEMVKLDFFFVCFFKEIELTHFRLKRTDLREVLFFSAAIPFCKQQNPHRNGSKCSAVAESNLNCHKMRKKQFSQKAKSY